MTQLIEQYEEYLVKYICKRIYSSLTILIYQKCFYIFLPIFIGFVFQNGGWHLAILLLENYQLTLRLNA